VTVLLIVELIDQGPRASAPEALVPWKIEVDVCAILMGLMRREGPTVDIGDVVHRNAVVHQYVSHGG
jgi:hypothetical protein